MSKGLRCLEQRDAVDLAWYCARVERADRERAASRSSYEPNYSSDHPAVAAERKLERLFGFHPGNKRADRVCHILTEACAIYPEASRYLQAAYDPQPETFDYTHRDSGLVVVVAATEGNVVRIHPGAEPHEPFFDSRESALVRFTPTLTNAILRKVIKDEREAILRAYEAIAALPESDADDLEALAWKFWSVEGHWTTYPSPQERHDTEARVLEIVAEKIAKAKTHTVKDFHARDAARALLSKIKTETNELHDLAADAFVQTRERLYPTPQRPKKAVTVVRWDDPAAWADAAE